MSEHTPTPWTGGPEYEDGTSTFIHKDGRPIADCAMGYQEEDDANCAIIVKAVNSHDALVKALQKVRSYNVDIDAGRINYRPRDHIQVIDEALASIKEHSK